MSTRIKWSNDGSQLYSFSGFSIPSKSTVSTQNAQKFDSETEGYQISATSINDGFLILFASPINLTKLDIFAYQTVIPAANPFHLTVKASSNTTTGFDGGWSDIGIVSASGTYTPSLTGYNYSASNITGLKFMLSDSSINGLCYIQQLFLYGSYVNSPVSYYDSTGTYELSGNYPVQFNNLYAGKDYQATIDFKIKNNTTSAQNYSVSAYSTKTTGDSFINNIKIVNNSVTASTVAVTGIPGGGFSNTLKVFANIPSSANPADGLHFFGIGTTVTG